MPRNLLHISVMKFGKNSLFALLFPSLFFLCVLMFLPTPNVQKFPFHLNLHEVKLTSRFTIR